MERERRARAQTKRKPAYSESYLLGYADDSESIEAIMKKFERVEQVLQEKRLSDTDDALANDEVAKEVFKQTSAFSVEQLRGEVDMINSDDELLLDMDDALLNEDYQFQEDEDELYSDDDVYFGKRVASSHRSAVQMLTKTIQYVARDGYVVRKRVRIVDPRVPIYTRMPSETLPLSWAMQIKPYAPLQIPSSITQHFVRRIVDEDLAKLGNDFSCVVMDPPWGPQFTLQTFRSLKNVKRLIKTGLLFVWVVKDMIPDVLDVVNDWNFSYVENIAWVQKHTNNTFLQEDFPYFRCSKLTLLVCRRRESKDADRYAPVDLQHQRNPDVVFDFVREVDGRVEKPAVIYTTIETLLPNARRLLLWGTPSFARTAEWSVVIEK